VIDLGCGNGRLLLQMDARNVTGVEIDSRRLPTSPRISAVIPYDRNWLQGDLFDLALWEGEYDLALIMPGRLLERDVALEFVTTLHRRAKTVVAYAYGDWQEKFIAACQLLGSCEKLRNDPFVWCAIVRPT
jgi:SAM-dependent methyltransferase